MGRTSLKHEAALAQVCLSGGRSHGVRKGSLGYPKSRAPWPEPLEPYARHAGGSGDSAPASRRHRRRHEDLDATRAT